MSVEVRDARLDDLLAITDIYNHYVRTSAATFDVEEVTAESRREWFDEHATTGRYRMLVAQDVDDGADAGVLGYAHSSQFRARPAYETSVEVSVYCRPDAVGRGVGATLYDRLLKLLAAEDLHRAYAGVALPNPASMKLHASFGFRVVGTYVEVGRKFGRYWDVCWLERALP